MAAGRVLPRQLAHSQLLPRLVATVDDRMGSPHGWEALTLFLLIWPHLDVEGRMNGHPSIVKGTCVPLFNTITPRQIDEYLEAMSELGLVRYYEAGGGRWIENPAFVISEVYKRITREKPLDIPPSSAGVLIGKASTTQLLLIKPEGTCLPSAKFDTQAPVDDSGIGEVQKAKFFPCRSSGSGSGLGSGLEGEGEVRTSPRRSLRAESAEAELKKRAAEILAYLTAARKRIKPGSHELRPTDTNTTHVVERLKAGRTMDECRAVVDAAAAEWRRWKRSSGDPSRDPWRFIEPVSMFRPQNFERYLAAYDGAAEGDPQRIREVRVHGADDE